MDRESPIKMLPFDVLASNSLYCEKLQAHLVEVFNGFRAFLKYEPPPKLLSVRFGCIGQEGSVIGTGRDK